MRKLAFSMMATAMVLSSCGGGDGEGGSSEPNNVTSTVTTSNERLKDFSQKGSTAFYSGMNFGGKKFNRVLYIAVADYEDVKVGMFSVDNPPKEGNMAIVAAIYGPEGTEEEKLTPLTPGKYSTNPDEEGKQFNVSILVNDGKSYPSAETFTGERVTYSNKVSGEVDLTEVSDSRAKGKLTYKVEGGHELTVDFDVAIVKDLWADMIQKKKDAGL